MSQPPERRIPAERPVLRGEGHLMKNEAQPEEVAAGTGSINFIDCATARIVLLEWVDGLITTNGDYTVQAGCDGTGTGTGTGTGDYTPP